MNLLKDEAAHFLSVFTCFQYFSALAVQFSSLYKDVGEFYRSLLAFAHSFGFDLRELFCCEGAGCVVKVLVVFREAAGCGV